MDADDVLSRPASPPDLVLRYGDHADAVVDVFLPPGPGRSRRPSRLVVAVHGGFWRQEYDRTHLRPLADALRRRGFVVALPEYRRLGGLGSWPETAADVEAGLAVTPGQLDGVAPGFIDPTAPLALAGHSAGGHLAIWAGMRAGPERVASIVALAPVADLRYAAAVRMGDGAVQELLGGEPDEQPDRYAEADVVSLLSRGVDVTIIQGTEDLEVTVEMNRRLASAPSGASFRYVELHGVDHFALIDPLSPVFETAVLPAFGRSHDRGSG